MTNLKPFTRRTTNEIQSNLFNSFSHYFSFKLFKMNQESNKSINTPQQWACKYDAFLLNEYEFTLEELNELQADRIRQSRRVTS